GQKPVHTRLRGHSCVVRSSPMMAKGMRPPHRVILLKARLRAAHFQLTTAKGRLSRLPGTTPMVYQEVRLTISAMPKALFFLPLPLIMLQTEHSRAARTAPMMFVEILQKSYGIVTTAN